MEETKEPMHDESGWSIPGKPRAIQSASTFCSYFTRFTTQAPLVSGTIPLMSSDHRCFNGKRAALSDLKDRTSARVTNAVFAEHPATNSRWRLHRWRLCMLFCGQLLGCSVHVILWSIIVWKSDEWPLFTGAGDPWTRCVSEL